MAFFGNTAVPAGWFEECTGVDQSRAGIGIDLFAKTSTTWGVGNGATTFGLPDAYTAGKFLRSAHRSVALGTAQSDQNKAHTHGLTAGSAAAGGVLRYIRWRQRLSSYAYVHDRLEQHAHAYAVRHDGFGRRHRGAADQSLGDPVHQILTALH
jgi:hypothetical protein